MMVRLRDVLAILIDDKPRTGSVDAAAFQGEYQCQQRLWLCSGSRKKAVFVVDVDQIEKA